MLTATVRRIRWASISSNVWTCLPWNAALLTRMSSTQARRIRRPRTTKRRNRKRERCDGHGVPNEARTILGAPPAAAELQILQSNPSRYTVPQERVTHDHPPTPPAPDATPSLLAR